MFENLWNYIKGYVIIKITGFSIERFLNLCINKGIYISDLEETKNGVICKIKIKDFKKLKEIHKKTGCKYKIYSKYGLPFFIFKNRKKKAFFIGAIIFVISIYFYSSFIWNIEILDNNLITDKRLLEFCKNEGLYLGAFKNKLDTRALQQSLKNSFPELSWVNIKINGTLATIKVSESIKPNLKEEENTFASNDIIANQEGIVTDIVTRKGTPLVKEKDAFKKGDILVSGELILKEGEEIKGTYLTKADADIRAKVEEEIETVVPYKYFIKNYTNKIKRSYEVVAFEKTFSLNLIKPYLKHENYDKIINRKQLKLGEKFTLPFLIITTKYKEYEKLEKEYTLDEAKQYADKLINEKINEKIAFSSDIIEKTTEYIEQEDKLIAKTKITLIKDIGEKSPVKISKENDEEIYENGTNQTSNT